MWKQLSQTVSEALSGRITARVLLLAGAILAGFMLISLLFFRSVTAPEEGMDSVVFFQIGTGSVGEDYFSVGERLAAIISRPPGTPRCEAGLPCGVAGLVAVSRSSSGPLANLRAVSAGLFDSALVPAPILYMATRGEGAFRGESPVRNVRAIASVYQEALYIVTSRNADIASLSAMKGMRVSIGEAGTGTGEAARAVLAANRIDRRSAHLFEHDLTTSIEMMLRGQLDAFFMLDAMPSPTIASLAARGSINLIPVSYEEAEDAALQQSGFAHTIIEADAYRFIPETRLLVVPTIWIVNENEEGTLIHRISDALFRRDNHAFLSGAGLPGLLPGSGTEQMKTAISTLPVPLHDGARRYFIDQGVIVETVPRPVSRPGRG